METLVRLRVLGNRVLLEFTSPEEARSFGEAVKLLAGGAAIEVESAARIVATSDFYDYMVRVRGIDETTARYYYKYYIVKNNGRRIDLDLAKEVSGNRWAAKAVRVYLDYLYYRGYLAWEEYQRLKMMFKIKKSEGDGENEVDVRRLVDLARRAYVAHGKYATIILLLYFSGARLAEAVKVVREFDPARLQCFGDVCAYRLRWRRGKKRCDYVFMPAWLAGRVKEAAVAGLGRYRIVLRNIRDYYNVDVKEFRKLHYQTCIDAGIERDVCEFMQSRRLSVGPRDYDKMKKRAIRAYSMLADVLARMLLEA